MSCGCGCAQGGCVGEQAAVQDGDAEIADRLTLAHKTVETHIGNLLRKLDARDCAGLVIAANAFGLAHNQPAQPSW